MDERNQQRIGNRTAKRSLRVVIGQAIDLLVSALAILVTRDAVLKFLKRRQVDSLSPITTRTVLDTDQPNQRRSGHQASEINLRAVTWTAIGLTISVIVICLGVGGLFIFFERQAASGSPPSGISTASRLPPAPRLQSDPTADWQQFLEAENAKLNSYGWIDKSAGVIRIPIDRAMDLLAQRGLPARGGDHEAGDQTPLQMRQEKAKASNP